MPCKACVYSVFVPAPLCCLASMLLALVGLALASKPAFPSVVLLVIILNTLSPSPSFSAHTPQHLPALSTTTASMDAMGVTAASERYVVVIMWRLSTPFPGVIAPGGSPARLLPPSSSPTHRGCLWVSCVALCDACPLPCRALPSFNQVGGGPAYHHDPSTYHQQHYGPPTPPHCL